MIFVKELVNYIKYVINIFDKDNARMVMKIMSEGDIIEGNTEK